jgi:hypothetical protein
MIRFPRKSRTGEMDSPDERNALHLVTKHLRLAKGLSASLLVLQLLLIVALSIFFIIKGSDVLDDWRTIMILGVSGLITSLGVSSFWRSASNLSLVSKLQTDPNSQIALRVAIEKLLTETGEHSATQESRDEK